MDGADWITDFTLGGRQRPDIEDFTMERTDSSAVPGPDGLYREHPSPYP